MALRLKLVVVGKLKESYLQHGVKDYLKRIQSYAKASVVEVRDQPFSEPLSPREELRVLDREAERILPQIPERGYVIALDRAGRSVSSEELAANLQRLMIQGQSTVIFLIGGSLGLAPAVLARCQQRMSFSRLTFPHQLMRLILLEQLYRALTIQRGEKYHK